MWVRKGCCPGHHCDERIWHAGLSPDGHRCLVAGYEDNVYIVWDVNQSIVLWQDDGYDGSLSLYPPLAEWVENDGCVTVHDATVAGRYRVFGLECNHAKTEHDGLILQIDPATTSLRIVDRLHLEVVCLKYESYSGDWAFASFSDDGSMIAVIEPYYVTFYGRLDGVG